MQTSTAVNLAALPLAPIRDPKDPVYSVVLAYKAEKVQIMQADDMIIESLTALGMASKQTFQPNQVGVEKGNRGTQGVNTLACKILASDILGVGWSNDATRHACCIRAKPGCSEIEDRWFDIVQVYRRPSRAEDVRHGRRACCILGRVHIARAR